MSGQHSKEYKREYDRRWIAARRKRCIELLGAQCVRCGSTENLEVDHINPVTKDPKLRKTGDCRGGMWSWSWERIEAELTKCQVLCRECHKKKSAGEHARGERVNHAKLTEDDIKAIRVSVIKPYRLIAEQYGVDASLIGYIKRGKVWQHVK